MVAEAVELAKFVPVAEGFRFPTLALALYARVVPAFRVHCIPPMICDMKRGF